MKRIMVMLMFLGLMGCSAPNTETYSTTASEMKLTYFKDTHDICYAVSNQVSYGLYHMNLFTMVPCEKVGL